MKRITSVLAGCFMLVNISYAQKKEQPITVSQIMKNYKEEHEAKKLESLKKDTIVDVYYFGLLPTNKDSVYSEKRTYQGINTSDGYTVNLTSYIKLSNQDDSQLSKSLNKLYYFNKSKRQKNTEKTTLFLNSGLQQKSVKINSKETITCVDSLGNVIKNSSCFLAYDKQPQFVKAVKQIQNISKMLYSTLDLKNDLSFLLTVNLDVNTQEKEYYFQGYNTELSDKKKQAIELAYISVLDDLNIADFDVLMDLNNQPSDSKIFFPITIRK
ncbi:hypothetical protein [Myroides sp. LJL119]